jgi:hypothetical protein
MRSCGRRLALEPKYCDCSHKSVHQLRVKTRAAFLSWLCAAVEQPSDWLYYLLASSGGPTFNMNGNVVGVNTSARNFLSQRELVRASFAPLPEGYRKVRHRCCYEASHVRRLASDPVVRLCLKRKNQNSWSSPRFSLGSVCDDSRLGPGSASRGRDILNLSLTAS